MVGLVVWLEIFSLCLLPELDRESWEGVFFFFFFLHLLQKRRQIRNADRFCDCCTHTAEGVLVSLFWPLTGVDALWSIRNKKKGTNEKGQR